MTKDELQKAVDDVITDCIRNDYAFGNYAHRVTEAVWPVLEAAEKERDDIAQQLVQSEIGKREISEARDGLQAEVGKLKDLEVSRCVKINGYIVDNARLAEEVERLRAKIAEMEKQEPARLVTPTAYRWRYRGAVMWQYGELTEETVRLAKEHNHEVQPLYLATGAKGEEK